MGNYKLSVLLSLIGKVGGRPRVTRSTVNCDSTFDQFCMNNGKCMLLVDLNEHHCQCDIGFNGPRCDMPEMVQGKMAEGEIILIVFCVGLLVIGLAGAAYFFFKWYKKNKFPRQQKRQGYRGVQLV
uniref:EGF-like domain-containing protein n=1 Tax=Oryzias sinensis TaxID=183150 RepID=A0A8C7WYP5_9TELE